MKNKKNNKFIHCMTYFQNNKYKCPFQNFIDNYEGIILYCIKHLLL